MSSRIFVSAMVVAIAACTSSTEAQSPAQWNRSAEGVTITPLPGGAHRLEAHFRIDASHFLTFGDLSTDILFVRNSSLLAIESIDFSAAPASAGGCGAGLCLSFQACICCSVGGEVICTCGGFVAAASTDTSSLTPGDQITIKLRPSPGALPEQDPSDDSFTVTFQPCVGDLDGSGGVNGIDLATMLGQWTGAAAYGPCPPIKPADLNGDCRINGVDLGMLLAQWGPCGPAT